MLVTDKFMVEQAKLLLVNRFTRIKTAISIIKLCLPSIRRYLCTRQSTRIFRLRFVQGTGSQGEV